MGDAVVVVLLGHERGQMVGWWSDGVGHLHQLMIHMAIVTNEEDKKRNRTTGVSRLEIERERDDGDGWERRRNKKTGWMLFSGLRVLMPEA